MADSAETSGIFQSDLIDLSGIPLDRLGTVDRLPAALAALHRTLSGNSAPLCDSGMAALCGTTPSGPAGATRDR
ncbi:hypothetical protein [Streptomyces beigongshangae]|uniref:hypothetical protein n=1 Tax=Streptomyces beigongshangae TaxID=2841597 RepID=UPI001C857607|nr:hypothetical protein [Streptomyces sp. REN17]